MDGETYYSKECVIFLNSVSNIVNIVKQTELLPDEVNIIVGSSEENDKSIAKLGNGFQRGRIPLKGETHKMITFCTSTAFAGVIEGGNYAKYMVRKVLELYADCYPDTKIGEHLTGE